MDPFFQHADPDPGGYGAATLLSGTVYLVDVFLEKVELLLHVGEVRGGQQRHNLRPQLRVIQHQLLYIIKIGLIYRTGTGNPCEDLYYKT